MKTKLAVLAAVLLLLSVSTPVRADGVVRGPDGLMIVFKEAPCTSPDVLPLIKPEFRDEFKQGAIRFQGRGMAACWIVDPDSPDVVYVLGADGNSIGLPRKAIDFDAGA